MAENSLDSKTILDIEEKNENIPGKPGQNSEEKGEDLKGKQKHPGKT